MSTLTPVPSESFTQRHLRFNFVTNLFDGGFFGFALGFSSFITVIPLFVSGMTDSATLIGLIPAIHNVGWQLPQLFTAGFVARQKRFKPIVMLLTIQERIPFLGLAIVAWFLPGLGISVALPLTFALLIWQGLGGGFTANAWQSMIGKIIPAELRGTFFGSQSAAANLFFSVSAVISGYILKDLGSPLDFTLCFLLNAAIMVISWIFLSLTREAASSPQETPASRGQLWHNIGVVLRRDVNFRWFLVVRILSQVAMMGFAFYTVYAVRHYHISEAVAGIMTGVLATTQTIANPIMGRLGDRFGHRLMMEVGLLAATLSALLAWQSPGVGCFYMVFALAGVASVAYWTIGMAMTLEFGSETERPLYIGMANTLIAPATILAPIFGGWLADTAGYDATFLVSAIAGLVTAAVIHRLLRNTRVGQA